MAIAPPPATRARLGDAVAVPGGVVALGEPGEERQVALRSFAIGRYPLTNAGLRDFAQATGHRLPPDAAARAAAEVLADHPATGLAFDGALAVCAWASAVLGRPVRLPTGDEWEAAARGADGRPYPWGDVFDPGRCACADGAWTTTPVDAHPAGAAACGAHDMAGNVWEWVGDPPDADGWRRVRGGCHLDTGWGLRACRALPADPLRATATTGLRIAWDLDARGPTRRSP
ncbi:MAG TPA: SUMF1/EgtB/PvdO family nonheme iron enzyme [Miltoncostaeaceae bacterium]|nr:SUMF1/EgtB/PvdO family nonheme iron enzyme [Miltoncostaeaceae bacterium]